jgi:hypothetical protein
VSRAKAKSSAPPPSAARTVAPELPPDVKLISVAALGNAEESLHAIRRHLSALLFNAEDSSSDSPAFATSSTRENMLSESAAAFMSLNLLEDALAEAADPDTFMRLRAHRDGES